MSFRRNLKIFFTSFLFVVKFELERGKFMCISRFVMGCVDIFENNKTFDCNHWKAQFVNGHDEIIEKLKFFLDIRVTVNVWLS